MSMAIWALCLIPLLIPLCAKYFLSLDISWKEYAVQAVSGVLIVCMIWAIGNMTANSDREILNGAVTGKEAWKFSCPTNTSNPCRNGYDCNCHEVCSTSTDSKGNQTKSCHTECDTCYEYRWEQNWYVNSNLQSRIEIDRVDEQGALQPDRWSSVIKGDPVSITGSYKNWVKASSKSLFKEDPVADERFAKIIPEYPIEIYDYYRINRVLTPNVKLANISVWNEELSKVLSIRGPERQLNTVVVIVKGVDRSYANAVRRSWHGFKKNDAVLFIGLDGQNRVAWGETMSWSKAEIFNVEARDYIQRYTGTAITDIEPKLFFNGYSQIAKSFVRRPMKEFEYLKGDIPPPNWLIWVAAIFALAFSGGTSYIFHRNNPFDTTSFGRY